MDKQTEEKFIALETKLAYLEDFVTQLQDVSVEQAREIDILKQENLNCIASILVNGKPAAAFNMHTVHDGFAPTGNPSQIEHLKQLSYLKYGRDRAEVEQEIQDKFRMG